jgi:metallo-beta-lactamase class B
MLKIKNDLLKTVILYLVIVMSCSIPVQVSGQEDFNTIKINNDLELIQLNESFFIHVSWNNSEKFGRFSSNGLILVKNGKALIIDTPIEESLTMELYNFLHDSLKVEVEKFIAGHYHDDCMGGINVLHAKNVQSIALDLTKQKCIEHNLPLPIQIFSDSLTFDFYGETVKCIYAGPGHTIDNISVYFPNRNILFGGCILKSISSKGLGNTADAVVNEWDKSVEHLMSLCGDVEIVIPGHGNFGNINLLQHTIKLVKENRAK